MARPLRIEYPDAVYHVSNYGSDGQRVFPSAKYYEAFLDGLAETCARLNVEVHSFCLLRDQYHLLIKTPEGNLSRFMRQVDGLYTQNYQRMKGVEGSLFRGRYKAVLVQADKYLLPLSRYIHCKVKPKDRASYDYSSYGYFTRKATPPAWFKRDEILKQLKVAAAKRALAYKRFIAQEVDEEMAGFYGKKNLSSVMGDAKFKPRRSGRDRQPPHAGFRGAQTQNGDPPVSRSSQQWQSGSGYPKPAFTRQHVAPAQKTCRAG